MKAINLFPRATVDQTALFQQTSGRVYNRLFFWADAIINRWLEINLNNHLIEALRRNGSFSYEVSSVKFKILP